MIRIGYNGVICVEAGGPTPGLGCAGRGIITALEKLEETGAYDVYKPDVILYDVLGDVVCGGFSMPMRNGYADKVFIITSGENMAIHAAANIAMAVDNFKNRGLCTAWRNYFKSPGCSARRRKSGRTGRRFSYKGDWNVIPQRAGGIGRRTGDDIDGMLSGKCYGRGISYDCQKDVHFMWWRITGGNLDVAASR